MTKANYIQWLEAKIVGCDELTGMEKEKWAFIQCLKKARDLELGQILPIDIVSGSFCACGNPKVKHICQNCGGKINYR